MFFHKNIIDRIKCFFKKLEMGVIKVGIEDKIISIEEAQKLERKEKKLVLTNGSFSVIHYGHLCYLNEAKKLGDILVVAVNTNDSIKRVKRYDAPSSDYERFYHLASLKAIDYIIPFNENNARHVIEGVKPDIYVKGGDYNIDTINKDERKLLCGLGIDIKFTGYQNGYSASNFVDKVKKVIFDKY